MTSRASRILHWIQVTADEVRRGTGENFVFPTRQVVSRYKRWPRGTVTSALTRFQQQGLIERIHRGVYQIITIFFEHFVSTVLYCGETHRHKETWYAITHAPFGGSLDKYADISEDMISAILDRKDDCYEPNDFRQYQNSKQVQKPDKGYTYPFAQVGRLSRTFKRTAVWRIRLEP
jgi:hypothetical protein